MSLHWHTCATCEEQLVCSCADEQQRILCPECKDLEAALKAAFGDDPKLEKVQ